MTVAPTTDGRFLLAYDDYEESIVAFGSLRECHEIYSELGELGADFTSRIARADIVALEDHLRDRLSPIEVTSQELSLLVECIETAIVGLDWEYQTRMGVSKEQSQEVANVLRGVLAAR